MKILKKILIAVLIIIAIPLIIAIFVKKDYAVDREIVINKPSTEVFNYIKYVKNQENFSVWAMADPAMKTTFTGTDGTVGFIYAWDGNSDVGKGEIEITDLIENQRLDMDLRFIKPMEGKGHAYMTTEAIDATSTKVKWHMQGESSYPMNFMNLFIDSFLGKSLETSLTNLKNVLEK
jgi:hypothetical protein